MVLFGRIIDAQKKSAIQGATVTVITTDGADTGISVQTESTGRFFINSPAITLSNKLRIEHPNYHGKDVPVTGVSDYGFIVLDEKPAEIISPTKLPSVPWWGWLLIIAGLAYAVSPGKKRR